MTEDVAKIVSEYTRIPVEQLQQGTNIGRKAVSNSIVLHRMYAAIAKAGIEVPGYQEIETFGELENRISGVQHSENGLNSLPAISNDYTPTSAQQGVGVDIEEINKMPRVNDFREDEFYTMNFASEEIAYCILQPDPYASFAGLFAAKEAIVKADNAFKKITFNKIFVDHLPGGQPVFGGFSISVSHVRHFSIAIAVKDHGPVIMDPPGKVVPPDSSRNLSLVISIIALVIAVIALWINLFK